MAALAPATIPADDPKIVPTAIFTMETIRPAFCVTNRPTHRAHRLTASAAGLIGSAGTPALAAAEITMPMLGASSANVVLPRRTVPNNTSDTRPASLAERP